MELFPNKNDAPKPNLPKRETFCGNTKAKLLNEANINETWKKTLRQR